MKLQKRTARSHLSPPPPSSMTSREWIKIKTKVESAITIEITHEDRKGQAPYQISESCNLQF